MSVLKHEWLAGELRRDPSRLNFHLQQKCTLLALPSALQGLNVEAKSLLGVIFRKNSNTSPKMSESIIPCGQSKA